MHALSSVTLNSTPKKSRKGVGGRPTLYRPEYCQKVIDFLSQGWTLTAFASSINVSRNAVDEWRDKHPLFGDACARAIAASQAWWEAKIRENLGNREFQGNVALTLMKARFTEFREPAKLELSGSVTIAGLKEDDIAKAQAVLLQSQVQAPAGADQK
jgi:hypothetical protein